MQIFDDSKKRIGTLTGFRNRTITSTLKSGDKELYFEYPSQGNMVDLIKEECYIRTKTDEYVIKCVQEERDYKKYTAVLNVEELEGQQFPYGFASQEQTVRACLEFAFEGTGWTVGICEITKKRTIDIDEKVSAWEVFQESLETYRCECQIDSINKIINVFERIGRNRGSYFAEGLNLRKLTRQSDTYDFYTRIIPIGKDGITIEWLGKPYIENFQYSKKVKTYTWKDERYTNTTSLIEDATAKLDELSKPYKVYAADVVDLARASDRYKNILDYEIGDTVYIISKKSRIKEKQRIVKIVENPENPKKNTVELSNTIKTFAEVQKTETELAKKEAISIATNATKKILSNYYTSEEIETKIAASQEAVELGVMHTLQGYYNKTETDSIIQLSKGEIELSVSQKYQSKSEMGEYSTTKEMQAMIELNIDAITLEVENNGTSSNLILKAGETILSSKVINITGVVKFADLSKAGGTTINGANITTGILKDAGGNTEWNLATGVLKSKKLTIESTNFKLTEAGNATMNNATATNATIKTANITNATINTATITNATINSATLNSANILNGKIRQETSDSYMEITNASIVAGYKNEDANEIDFSNRVDGRSAMAIVGENGVQIRTPNLYVANSTSGNVYRGYNGTRRFVIDLDDIGGGELEWTIARYTFVNGIMT